MTTIVDFHIAKPDMTPKPVVLRDYTSNQLPQLNEIVVCAICSTPWRVLIVEPTYVRIMAAGVGSHAADAEISRCPSCLQTGPAATFFRPCPSRHRIREALKVMLDEYTRLARTAAGQAQHLGDSDTFQKLAFVAQLRTEFNL